MNYLQTDRRKKRLFNRDRVIGIIFGLTLIILGSLFSENLVSGVAWIKNIFTFSKLTPQYTELNQNFEYLNSKIMALQSENEGLKSFLNADDKVNIDRPRGSLFSVGQRPPFSPYDSIVVNGGSENGIQLNDLAFASEDILIGYVTTVLPHTSVVTLYSSSNQKQEVYVGTSSNAVVSEGRGGGAFYIKVPNDVKINVGDPILWPAMQNILIGVVNRVDTDPGEAFTYVMFKSLVPLYSIRYVEIVPNNL